MGPSVMYEVKGQENCGQLWEQIPFPNLQYLFPILKGQLPNIYKYPSGFALPISPLVVFAFLSVACIVSL